MGDVLDGGRRSAHQQQPPLRVAGDLQRRHLPLDERFMDVEVEEADLGVGDPADRLGVDPDQLKEGDQREPGERTSAQWRIAFRSSSFSIPSALIGVPSNVISRSISSGSSPVCSAASSRV